MAEISAAMVKELREKTGAGMMDCKKALIEAGGEGESAVDWLRKKGLAAAAKKAGRTAAEGLVGVVAEGNRGAVVEVNAETDFVARNEIFQSFVRSVARLALEIDSDLEALQRMEFSVGGRNVADELTHLIATIGENMGVRRVQTFTVDPGIVAAYIHNQVAEGLGKIGVLVALESSGNPEKLQVLGRQLAMHIAAANPQAVDRDGVDASLLERERDVLADQARASGKTEEIVQKMVEGRLRKFYEDVALLEQTYVIDGESKVGKAIEAYGNEIGAPIKVVGFARFQLGEGIEREQSDFAAEVAAAARG